ncbi:HutD/Ves family protein [Aminobacter sp. HY435]|uniref:HutD/Ves family protein n=1 Tax=Aminobacter sp. HY435 TaxID=2970917 RepID=UPI0022B97023|nr:HutD family protein [Aminobacter sp. HY435]
MRIIRHADCRPMPWKNGGGVTTEIIAWPPAAGLDDFHWRISMAQVAAGGPFSVFSGIDRTLTVLEGTMRLAIEGAGEHLLSRHSEPCVFPGDVATSAKLVDGPVLDFNVMTRRGSHNHRVRRLELAREADIEAGDGTFLLFIASGAALIGVGEGTIDLGERDTLCLDPGAGRLRIAPATAVSLLAVNIMSWRHPPLCRDVR